MKKRILSILVTVAMTLSFATVSVSADSAELNDGYLLEGWTISKYNDFMKPTITRSRAVIDTAEKHSGEAALRIHGASGHSHSGILKTTIGGLDASKKYKAGLWVKSPSKSEGSVYLQNNGDYKYLGGQNIWQAGYAEWTYLETEEISPSANGAIDLRFNVANVNKGSMWIDDMSLVEVGGDGTNFMPDGGFENAAAGIRNVNVAYSASGSVFDAVISWTNPNNADISSAYVVDAEGNTVAQADSTEANGIAKCTVTGLTMGEETEYKIIVALTHGDVWADIVPDGNVEKMVDLFYESHNIPANSEILNDGSVLSDWTISKYGDFMSSTITRSRVLLDTAEKHSGEAALRIHGASGQKHNGFLKTTIVGLDASKKYKAGFWIKSPSKSEGSVYLQNNGDYKYLGGQNLWQAGYAEWTYLETEEISPSASGAIDLRFNVSNVNKGSMWIDDMSLVEVGGNGTNLMADGDFENAALGARDIKVSYSKPNSWLIDEATISWTNPNNTHISRVYVVDADGNEVAQARSAAANGKASCTVSGVPAGKTTEYKIIAEVTHDDVWKDVVAPKTFEKRVVVNPLADVMKADYTYNIGESYITIDTTDGYSNNTSLKIESAMTKDDGQYGGVELYLPELDASKTYQLSYKYKCENASGNGVSVRIQPVKAVSSLSLANTEWTASTPITFEGSNADLVQIWIDKTKGTIWFDDIVVREYDAENGICVGDNLLSNGGFELTNNNKVRAISFDGTETVSANVELYNAYNASAYIATYDETGKLVSVNKVDADSQGNLMQTLTPSVTVGSGVKEIKAFVWNGMNPMCDDLIK